MKKVLLEGKGISKKVAETKTPILNKVDITLYDGDFTVIMGKSGAGKSTLLYALSGMNKISEGEILYQNENIAKATEKTLAKLRFASFGFVFQQTNLVSNLTLFENVCVAGYLDKKKSTSEINEKAIQLLRQMNVEEAMNRLPHKVSGGEAQRAAIARALINEPQLLFADEPTGALNKKNSDEVLAILQSLHERGQGILMVTHDVHAAAHGNRILYMEDGEILEEIAFSSSEQMDVTKRETKVKQWLTSLMW